MERAGRKLERQCVYFPKYTQVCSAQLSGILERFRRVTISSDLVLMWVIEESRIQQFLRFFPANLHPQTAFVSLAEEGDKKGKGLP